MDTIIEGLRSDDPPARAVENVATLVSRLRTTLGSDVIDGGRAGYRLVIPPGCTVDADDAIRLVEEAEARLDAGHPALAATAASQALGVLGAGAPLEDETAGGEWLDELRRELERWVRRARVVGWRASAGIGEHRRALALAEQAVAADPLDEEAHRAVITAYHRLGESGEALAAFERVRTVLVEELGADPSAETQALYLAVLRSELPGADIRLGSMFELPWPAGTFDVVTSINGVWGGCGAALVEARRVLRSDGWIAISFWGDGSPLDLRPVFKTLARHAPERHLAGMKRLNDIAHHGVAESMLTDAGFVRTERHHRVSVLEWPDPDIAWRAVSSTGPAVPALRHAGRAALKAAVLDALEPCRDARGIYRFRNDHQFVLARRP